MSQKTPLPARIPFEWPAQWRKMSTPELRKVLVNWTEHRMKDDAPGNAKAMSRLAIPMIAEILRNRED